MSLKNSINRCKYVSLDIFKGQQADTNLCWAAAAQILLHQLQVTGEYTTDMSTQYALGHYVKTINSGS